MVAQASPQEAEAEESLQAGGQPGLHSKTVSKRKQKRTHSYMGKEKKEDISCQLYIYRKIIPWL